MSFSSSSTLPRFAALALPQNDNIIRLLIDILHHVHDHGPRHFTLNTLLHRMNVSDIDPVYDMALRTDLFFISSPAMLASLWDRLAQHSFGTVFEHRFQPGSRPLPTYAANLHHGLCVYLIEQDASAPDLPIDHLVQILSIPGVEHVDTATGQIQPMNFMHMDDNTWSETDSDTSSDTE